MAWIAAREARTIHAMIPNLMKATFTPFLFVMITIIWVVLSRVVPPFVRMTLFIVWIGAFVVSIAWAAGDDRMEGAIAFGAFTLVICFFLLVVATHAMHLRTYRFITGLFGFIVVGVTGLMLLIARKYEDPKYLTMSAIIVLYGWFQVWSTMQHVRSNETLTHIDTSCIFSVMAPWVEVIEAFQVAHNAFVSEWR